MMIITMPVYFTLQEALAASQTAHKDYNPRMKGGVKGEAKFIQKQEIKPIIDLTPIEPAPIPEEPAEDNSALLAEQVRLQAQRDKKKVEEPPDPEIFKDYPPLTVGLSVVKIDESRKQRQLAEEGEEVKQIYSQDQNAENKIMTRLAKWTAGATTVGGKIVKQSVFGLANMARHPIATAQNIVREPFEKQEITFTGEINRRLKTAFFAGAPELPLVVPDEFIQLVLEKGKQERNKHKTASKIKDYGPSAWGVGLDTRQKRAVEWLIEELKKDPAIWSDDIKNIRINSLKYARDHARGFSTTICQNDKPLPNQDKFNKRILLKNEDRKQLEQTKNEKIRDEIKTKIRPFVDRTQEPTPEEQIQLMKDVFDIYKSNDALTSEELQKGEIATDITALIFDLRKDPSTKKYYLDNWDKLNIVCYKAESRGDARGGDRQLSLNQRIAIEVEERKDKLAAGGVGPGLYPAAAAAADTVTYLGGYLAAYGIGVLRGAPLRTASQAAGILGPLVSGTYGAIMESADFTLFGSHRTSRATAHHRRVSRETAFSKKGIETDYARKDLETALVEAVPATELTKSINSLILEDPNNLSSETKKNLTKDQIKELLSHISHAKARLDLTQISGGKDLEYVTQNWVSFTEGRDQRELTNLKAANIQAYARLLDLAVREPSLFADLPFYDSTNVDSLDNVIDSFTKIISAGLKEGLPSTLLEGTSPLSTFTGQDFYKQIFEGSGIPATEVDKVNDYIRSLDSTSVVSGKKISEWMKEENSFRVKKSLLKSVKLTRAIVAAGTAATTSAILSGGTHLVLEAIAHEFPQQQAQAPIPDAGTHMEPRVQNIDISTLFTDPTGKHHIEIPMWDPSHGKIENFQIPLGANIELKADGAGHYDLVSSVNGQVVFQDMFVVDSTHPGSFIPNPNFKFPDSGNSQVAGTIDLGQYFKPEHHQDSSPNLDGSSFRFWDKADDYRLVWAHSGHIIPDKDFIFDTSGPESGTHPHGIEIRFAEDTVRDPNTGAITTLLSHFEDKSMTTVLDIKDFFGPGKDGHLLLDNCIEKVSDGKGGYYYSLKFDPTSNKELTFADGTKVTMAQVAQIVLNEKELLKPENQKIGFPDDTEFHGANDVFGFKGSILMGYKVEAPKTVASDGGLSGHNVVPGGSDTQIFQPVHYVSANGQMGSGIIETPGTPPTETPTLTPIPGQIPVPVNVPIPNAPIEVPPITKPVPVDFIPVPGPIHLPNIETTTSPPAPLVSTPLPQSIIDQNKYVVEKATGRPQTTDEVIAFTNNQISRKINEDIRQKETKKIIIQRYTPSQQRFLENHDVEHYVSTTIINRTSRVLKLKLDPNNPQILSDADKTTLKTEVKNTIKNTSTYSEKQADLIADYLIQKNYYDASYRALQERAEIDRQLAEINRQLASSTPIPPRPTPPTPPTELDNLSPEEIKKIDKNINDFTDQLANDFPTDIFSPEFNDVNRAGQLLEEVENFIYKKIFNQTQLEIFKNIPINSLGNIYNKLDPDILEKMQVGMALDTREKKGLYMTVINEISDPNESNVVHQFLVYQNQIISQVREKMEGEEVDDQPLDIKIDESTKIAENDDIPAWLKDDWDNLGSDRNPDQTVATGLKFDDRQEMAENGGGEISGEELFDIYAKAVIQEEKAKNELDEYNNKQTGFNYLSEPEYVRLSDTKQKTHNDKENISRQISMEIENIKLPAILGVTPQQSVGTRATHDAFYPLSHALVEFEELKREIQLTNNRELDQKKQDAAQRISDELNNYNNAALKDIPGFVVKISRFGDLIIEHARIIKEIKVPAPIA